MLDIHRFHGRREYLRPRISNFQHLLKLTKLELVLTLRGAHVALEFIRGQNSNVTMHTRFELFFVNLAGIELFV